MDYRYVTPPPKRHSFVITGEEANAIFLKIAKDKQGLTFRHPSVSIESVVFKVDGGTLRYESHFRVRIEEITGSLLSGYHIWRFSKAEMVSILNEYLRNRGETIPDDQRGNMNMHPALGKKIIYSLDSVR